MFLCWGKKAHTNIWHQIVRQWCPLLWCQHTPLRNMYPELLKFNKLKVLFLKQYVKYIVWVVYKRRKYFEMLKQYIWKQRHKSTSALWKSSVLVPIDGAWFYVCLFFPSHLLPVDWSNPQILMFIDSLHSWTQYAVLSTFINFCLQTSGLLWKQFSLQHSI